MKKILISLLLLTGIITLTGCDKTPEIIDDTLPAIELNGDLLVVLKVGTTFTDPGASIIGDFDLDVEVDSDLDVNTLGTYTITYSIEYNSNTYNVFRTILVVDPVIYDLDLNISTIEVNDAHASFSVYLDDPEGLLYDTAAVLYENNTEINRISFADGTNLVDFTAFKPNTTYTIVLEGHYMYDNNEYSLKDYTLEFTTPNFDTAVPSLELIGDATITVDQYDYFVDPGVTIIGNFDLPITTTSLVDTNTPGSYTILYSIEYRNIVYSATRTVLVIAEIVVEDHDFEFSITATDITSSTATLTISVNDPDDILVDGIIDIYAEDDSLVDSLKIVHGLNTFTLTGLTPDSLYTVSIFGEYTENDQLKYITDVSSSFRTLALSVLSFTYLYATVEDDALHPVIQVVDSASTITEMKVVLYSDNIFVQEQSLSLGINNVTFDNVDPDMEYELRVEYQYIPEGTSEPVVQTETLGTISTLPTPVPTLENSVCYDDYTSIFCGFAIDYDGFSDVYVYAHVMQGETVVGDFDLTEDYTILLIEELPDNTEYNVTIIAEYTHTGTAKNYTDIELDSFTVSTLKIQNYSIPYIENFTITVEEGNSGPILVIEFDLRDPDETIFDSTIIHIKSSRGTDADVATVGHNSFTYEGYPIYYNVQYTITIDTDYMPIEDEYENNYVIYDTEQITPPDVTVDTFVPEEMYFQGDNIILVLTVQNDDDLPIVYVTINGIVHDTFLFPSNNETLYIDLGYETSVMEYAYTLENIGISAVNDTTYVLETTDSTVVDLQLTGSVVPEDATISFNEITTDDYTLLLNNSTATYADLYIHINNPYNMDITSLKLGNNTYTSSEFEMVTFKTIRIQVEVSRYTNNYFLTQIEYTRNGETITTNFPWTNGILLYGYLTEDIVSISTGAELQAIQPGTQKYYVLTNDIDLTGMNFIPIGDDFNSFSGVFDGNGYTIDNLFISSALGTQAANGLIGLFGKSNGNLFNVHLHNANVWVVADSDIQLSVGILAGYSIGTMYNITITGDSSIHTTGLTTGYIGGISGRNDSTVHGVHSNANIIIDGSDYSVGGELKVGGLFGIQGQYNVDHSSAAGNITTINTGDTTIFAGGLIGEFNNGLSQYATPIYIANSYATGDINVENTYTGAIGGLLGKGWANYAATISIINSYACGNLTTTTGKIAGLVGEDSITIINSFATGNATSTSTSPGRIVGQDHYLHFTNVYTYNSQILTQNDVVKTNGKDFYYSTAVMASSVEFNDSNFYTKHLKWSTYFFNTTTLDVENGVLPVFND